MIFEVFQRLIVLLRKRFIKILGRVGDEHLFNKKFNLSSAAEDRKDLGSKSAYSIDILFEGDEIIMNCKIESVLYIRSANNSRESLASQRLEGEKYAKQNSLSFSIIEDAQSSGIIPFNEPSGLRWLIHLIEVGLIKVVIIDSLIRISRDINQVLTFGSLMEKHNAKQIVLDEAEEYRS